MQGLFNVVKVFIDKLNSTDIDYMIVGSLGSIIYGEPRMTRDLDLVINIQSKDAKLISKLFPIKDFYCPPDEVIIQEVITKGQFSLIHHKTGFKVDLIVCKNNAHSIKEFERRKKIEIFEGLSAYVASPEDIIIKKLIYFKEGRSQKHIDDIKGMLANTEINNDYVNEWIVLLGLVKEWALIS